MSSMIGASEKHCGSTFIPCSYSSDSVWVDTHQMYNVYGNAAINWGAPKAGRYGFIFATSVQNLENKVLFRSSDYRDVIVPEADKKS